ncbi:hypothetical protein F5Y10DRAFT_240833 [Nemania abortiva]|nr:hypothetical protein F5Y10DRAFT_240833 [Nemania abortiva]
MFPIILHLSLTIMSCCSDHDRVSFTVSPTVVASAVDTGSPDRPGIPRHKIDVDEHCTQNGSSQPPKVAEYDRQTIHLPYI